MRRCCGNGFPETKSLFLTFFFPLVKEKKYTRGPVYPPCHQNVRAQQESESAMGTALGQSVREDGDVYTVLPS